jgi:ADP-ribose pyrophosphatase
MEPLQIFANITESGGWETVRREVCYSGPHARLEIEHVKTPSRQTPQAWTVVHRKAAAVVAPITEEGKFVLIKQERIPIRRALWEFPAGQIDEEAEHDAKIIRATALREMREESGYELSPRGELVSLGYFFSSQGFTDEHGYLFVARGVRKAAQGHSPDEAESILDCREFSQRELKGMVAANEIVDANTLSLYARMCAAGLIP